MDIASITVNGPVPSGPGKVEMVGCEFMHPDLKGDKLEEFVQKIHLPSERWSISTNACKWVEVPDRVSIIVKNYQLDWHKYNGPEVTELAVSMFGRSLGLIEVL